MSEEIRALLANEQQFNDLVQASFNEVDTDKSGQISSTELFNVVSNLMSESGLGAPSQEQVNEIMTGFDTDQNGSLSVKEFGEIVRLILQSMVEA